MMSRQQGRAPNEPEISRPKPGAKARPWELHVTVTSMFTGTKVIRWGFYRDTATAEKVGRMLIKKHPWMYASFQVMPKTKRAKLGAVVRNTYSTP